MATELGPPPPPLLEALKRSEVFHEFDDEQIQRLAAFANRRRLKAGQYLFKLGDDADEFFVVLSGKIEFCFPLTYRNGVTKNVTFETRGPGAAVGWSAFVEPHRMTLSARASEPTEVASFSRHGLEFLFEDDPQLGYTFLRDLAEVIGHRLLQTQALWQRSLQRSVSGEFKVGAGDD